MQKNKNEELITKKILKINPENIKPIIKAFSTEQNSNIQKLMKKKLSFYKDEPEITDDLQKFQKEEIDNPQRQQKGDVIHIGIDDELIAIENTDEIVCVKQDQDCIRVHYDDLQDPGYQEFTRKIFCEQLDEWQDNLDQKKKENQIFIQQQKKHKKHFNMNIQNTKLFFKRVQMDSINNELQSHQMPMLNSEIIDSVLRDHNVNNNQDNSVSDIDSDSNKMKIRYLKTSTQIQDEANKMLLQQIFQQKINQRLTKINCKSSLKLSQQELDTIKKEIVLEQTKRFETMQNNFKSMIHKPNPINRLETKLVVQNKIQHDLQKVVQDLKSELEKIKKSETYFQEVEDKLFALFNQISKEYTDKKAALVLKRAQISESQIFLQEIQDKIHAKQLEREEELVKLKYKFFGVKVKTPRSFQQQEQFLAEQKNLEKIFQDQINQLRSSQIQTEKNIENSHNLREQISKDISKLRQQQKNLQYMIREHYQNRLKSDPSVQGKPIIWLIKALRKLGDKDINKFKYPSYLDQDNLKFLNQNVEISEQIDALILKDIHDNNNNNNPPTHVSSNVSKINNYNLSQDYIKSGQQQIIQSRLRKLITDEKSDLYQLKINSNTSPSQQQQQNKQQISSPQSALNQQILDNKLLQQQIKNIQILEEQCQQKIFMVVDPNQQNRYSQVKQLQEQLEVLKKEEFERISKQFYKEKDPEKLQDFETLLTSLFGKFDCKYMLKQFYTKKLEIQKQMEKNKTFQFKNSFQMIKSSQYNTETIDVQEENTAVLKATQAMKNNLKKTSILYKKNHLSMPQIMLEQFLKVKQQLISNETSNSQSQINKNSSISNLQNFDLKNTFSLLTQSPCNNTQTNLQLLKTQNNYFNSNTHTPDNGMKIHTTSATSKDLQAGLINKQEKALQFNVNQTKSPKSVSFYSFQNQNQQPAEEKRHQFFSPRASLNKNFKI